MEDALKKAIKKELVKKPSAGFVDRVMDTIHAMEERREYVPLISKTTWWILAVVFLFVLAISFIAEQAAQTGQHATDILGFLEGVNTNFVNLYSDINWLKLAAISFSAFVLLWIDGKVSSKTS